MSSASFGLPMRREMPRDSTHSATPTSASPAPPNMSAVKSVSIMWAIVALFLGIWPAAARAQTYWLAPPQGFGQSALNGPAETNPAFQRVARNAELTSPFWQGQALTVEREHSIVAFRSEERRVGK